ncbi:MAG: hypothetical protein KAU07_02160 [Candidatus Andersenbacteria bacterium]|nr:hypothetical protein [Candidatus Andersenbacteria bacterium]
MFKQKENPQVFKENKKERYSMEDLKKMIEMKIEISGKNNKEERGVIKISEELRDEIVAYLYNKFEIKGLKEGEELSLYFYGGDLYLNALEPKGEVLFSWLIEDEEIIKDIEELILEI